MTVASEAISRQAEYLALGGDPRSENNRLFEAAAGSAGLCVRVLGHDPRRAVALSQPGFAFRAAGGFLAAALQLGADIRLAGPTPAWFAALGSGVTGRVWSLVHPAAAVALVIEGVHLVKLADGKHPAFPARRFSDPDLLRAALKAVHAGASTELLATPTWLPIHSEYRVFTRGTRVLAYSPYLVEDDPWTPLLKAHRASFHDEAAQFVESLLPQLGAGNIPPAAVLDVARLDDGRFVLLEANQPWSSGLYGCDPYAALEAVIESNQPGAIGSDQRWTWRPDLEVFNLRWHDERSWDADGASPS